MENIHLDSITETHLKGTWEVKEWVVNNSSQTSQFTNISHLEIANGIFKSINGKECTGKLVLVREKEIIYNPQLVFHINKDEAENAIITRLFLDNEGKQKTYNLTLYFSTGLELVLRKINQH